MIAYVAGAEGCISAAPPCKTPMDEKKDYVGLPPCCTEQGRVTAHGALWAMDVRTGKIVNKANFQPRPSPACCRPTAASWCSPAIDRQLAAMMPTTLKEV